MTYDSEVLADLPVAYWKLGESAGPTLFDSSGNGHDVAVLDDAGWLYAQDGLLNEDAGVSAKALKMTIAAGASTLGQTAGTAGANTAFNSASWSVEWVFKLDVIEGGILSRPDGSGGTLMAFSVVSNRVNLIYTTPSGTGTFRALGPNPLVVGTTYHFVVTYDGSNIRAYVNGALVTTTAQVISTRTKANQQIQLPGGGRMTLEKIAFYDSVLSLSRVQAHYDAGRAYGIGLSGGSFFNLITPVDLSMSGGSQFEIVPAFPLSMSGGSQMDAAVIPTDHPAPDAPGLPTFAPAAGARVIQRRSATYPDPEFVDGVLVTPWEES